MKRNFFLLLFLFLIGAQFRVNAQELTVSNIQFSRQDDTQSTGNEITHTIILTKEGTKLNVQILNYESYSETISFLVKASLNGGSNGAPYSLSVDFAPGYYKVMQYQKSPYNVSFTINGLETNSFLFSCWWHEGVVTLTDGESLELVDILEDVSINGIIYTLHKLYHTADLKNGENCDDHLYIPSEVDYEGQKYAVTSVGYGAFANNKTLSYVEIPSSVTSIGSTAFYECTNLIYAVIQGAKSIGYSAFHGCTNLANIFLPNSLTSIQDRAFKDCTSLISVIIPEGVTNISNHAFAYCTNLRSATLPGNVTSIGVFAFTHCDKLEDIYCRAESVPTADVEAFSETPIASATLHVPAVSVDMYKAVEPWKDFGNIVATASDVQSSGCLNHTRAGSNTSIQSISLLKEGNILTVNLHNYWSQCATDDFEVIPSVSDGNNSDPYTISVKVESIGENDADCICPYNISFTIHDVEANSFYFKCWWFKGQVNLTEGETWVMSNEYYPEGTKWTEIRLDTLQYDSWYSKVGDEWVPNYETVEYSVKGTYTPKYWESPFKCVYTNSQEWTDSLTLLIYEGEDHGIDMGVLATVPVIYDDDTTPFPGEAYYFDWRVGITLRFVDIIRNNATAIYPPGTFDFGKIEEIKEGEFGGVRPLKYTDINGVRIIQGIGVTTWNDGECLFGPVEPYHALSFFKEGFPYEERHYRSMLVHFERNGEVLYDVWPAKETVSYTKDQMATIILPTAPDASKGKYYALNRCEEGKIIFTEEREPKARVPYIIVPKEDFSIDLNKLDLESLLSDTVSVKGAMFIGSYSSAERDCQDGFYIDILDATPDCQIIDTDHRKAAIGALRAYLVAPWDDPYTQGPTKGVPRKREIVLQDNGTSLTPNPNTVREGRIYDLSGRKINSQFSTFNSQFRKKGLYIKAGKKFLVK